MKKKIHQYLVKAVVFCGRIVTLTTMIASQFFGAVQPVSATSAPVITEGDSTSVTMSQNGSPTAFGLTLHATDVDADTLTWGISTPANHGTASVSGTGNSKVIGYSPDTDYAGSDSFVVQVDDGNGGTDTFTLNVTIAGMISYWKLDEGSGAVASDSLGINDGTIYGATWPTGKVNEALSFDGNDYIEIPDSATLTIPNQVTVEAWVNIAEFTGGDQSTIIAKWRDSEPFSHNYFLGFRSSGEAVFYIGLNGGISGVSSQPLQVGQWYHLTGTYDGSMVRLYVNGVLANSVARTGLLETGLTKAYIGASPEGQFPRYFHGLIDETAVYNKALTLEDIEGHYQNGLSGLGYDFPNTPPAITEGDSVPVRLIKNNSRTPFSLTLHATDADADTLTWSISSQASHGTASVSGTGISKAIEYTPVPGYEGSDSFVVQVNDGNGGMDAITVNVDNSSAWIQAIPSGGGINAFDWPLLGIELTFTIDDPHTPQPVDYTTTATTMHPWWGLNMVVAEVHPVNFNLQAGQIITVAGGGITRTLIVRPLGITTVDVNADTVSGTSAAGRPLWVQVHISNGFVSRHITVESDGKWTADFQHPGSQDDEQETIDIQNESNVEVNDIGEDDGRTVIFWNNLHPYIEASPAGNWIHARGWPTGKVMTLEIDDPTITGTVNYTRTATMGQNPWNPTDPNDIVADFDMSGFTLKTGDIVTISGSIDGVTKTKELTVSELKVTAVDVSEDTVSGVATPGKEVEVCLNMPNNCISRRVTATDGTWTVDYTSDHDLQAGDNGWAAEYDTDSDRTWSDWNVPNPNFQVRANNDQIEAWEWPLNSTLTVKIYSSGIEIDPADKITTGVVTGPADWDPRTYVSFNLNDFDIQPGDLVTISDGVTIKKHIVTALAFDVIDKAADTVSGFAEAGSHVDAWACDNSGNCYNRHVTANSSGKWIADWSEEGTQLDEQNIFDLVSGTWVDSSQNDIDGDGTMYGVPIPDTNNHSTFGVRANEDFVEGWNWTDGSTVRIDIDSNGDGLPDISRTASVKSNSSIPMFSYDFKGKFDIRVGDVVTVNDGVTIKSTTVTKHSITNIDFDTDIVSGISDPGSNVSAFSCNNTNCYDRCFVADATTGAWQTDFSKVGLGCNNNVQGALDIVPGMWVDSQQVDNDTDSTMYRVQSYPGIVARLTQNQVDAYNWPLGTALTLIINSWTSPDQVISELCDPLDPSAGTCANFQVGSAHTLTSGDKVKVEGGGITLSMTVADVHVTNMNADDDTVSGTAGDGIDQVVIRLWSSPTDISVTTDVTNNTWIADFTGIYDLKSGDYGIAKWETGSIWTSDYWEILNPSFTSFSFASPAATGTISEGTHKIAVTVPYGTDVTALSASFVTTGTSVKVGATTQESGVIMNNFTNPVTYTVTAANGTAQNYVVTVTVAANSAKDITAFSFASPAATGVFTGTNISITVPFGTDVTSLVASFTTTGGSVKVGNTTQVSGTTTNNFTSPVTYRVTATDASTKDYTVTVTLAASAIYKLFLPLLLR